MDKVSQNKIVRLSKSCIGSAEKNAVMGVLDRGYLGMGAEVQNFEEALTSYFGRPVACVGTGTAALQLALEAIGVGNGDEVLVPSLTYVASFQSISATGAMPVACDINANSLLIDINDAEKRITNKTVAIMPVHYSGAVGELDALYKLAHKYNLRVIEDAAHAFGSSYKGVRVGGFGDIACFSFDGIKNITSGEGGCVVTKDITVLSRVRDARLLGVEKDTEKRYSNQRSWEFEVSAQGWRYHMSNVMAAIGLEQLKRMDELSEVRRSRAKLYDSLLKNQAKIKLLPNDYDQIVPHIYVVQIKGLKGQGEIQEYFIKHGIQTGVHYQPNHLLDYYKKKKGLPLPVTECAANEILTLPLHPEITEQDVKVICSLLINYCGK